MAEKEAVFSSRIKYKGIFSFSDFYEFCYQWITEETGLDISEDKYSEKISGEAKNIEVKWSGEKDITDYFRFEIKIVIMGMGLKKVEINQGGKKIETNTGTIEIKVTSSLIRDYKGKFEINAFNKFLREIYEKWVIPSRIDALSNEISEESDEFLSQAKSYLDLEGKK